MDELKLKNIKLDLVKPGSLKARRLEPHIRKNKISNHPAIIIGEDGYSYLFLPMTSNPISNTKKLRKNPNPLSKNPSYVIFRMRANKKSAFTAPLNWTISENDLLDVIKYAKKKIK